MGDCCGVFAGLLFEGSQLETEGGGLLDFRL